MNVVQFVTIFRILVLGWETVTLILKTKTTSILVDAKSTVLWLCMSSLVNSLRRLNKH